jgi:hypothetical protein
MPSTPRYQSWRKVGGPAIECVTLADGPPGSESQAHVEQVVQPITRSRRLRPALSCRLGSGGGEWSSGCP